MDDIKQVLARIGEKQGVDLTLDDIGAAILPLTGDRVLHLQYQANIEEFVLIATLGEVPEAGRRHVFEQLLAANYYWRDTFGATLAWHPELEQVVIELAVKLQSTDEATFETVFGNFLELQESWAKRLQAELEIAGEAPSVAYADSDELLPEEDVDPSDPIAREAVIRELEKDLDKIGA